MRHVSTHLPRAAAPGRPKQGPTLPEAEPGRKQSSGLFEPGEELGLVAQRDLQGRSPYSVSGVLS
jgi:hypothetical protein